MVSNTVTLMIRAVNWALFRLLPWLWHWLRRLWMLCVVVAFLLAVAALFLQWLWFGFRDRPSDLGG